MPRFTIRASNFRAIERLEWSPEGLCLLTGANGAGKSTTLSVFEFLRILFQRGHEVALRHAGGVSFQRLTADADDPVEFSLIVDEAGATERLVWKLQMPMSPTGLRGTFGEELRRGDSVVARAGMFSDDWFYGAKRLTHDDERCCAKRIWDQGEAAWMRPLVDLLSGFRVYGTYWLNQVKKFEPNQSADTYLHGSGRNLWSVLANWKGSPIRFSGQFEWVMTEARKAFPGILGSIEFDRGFPYLYKPGATDPADGLLPQFAADGVLTGLLHLCAVAGAPPGSVVAFDEVENQLHPHAIRSILDAMELQAEERDLTIIATTHSPVVMNRFRDAPEQLYVLDESLETQPLPLTEVEEVDSLLQVELGELYDRLTFAAPNLDAGD